MNTIFTHFCDGSTTVTTEPDHSNTIATYVRLVRALLLDVDCRPLHPTLDQTKPVHVVDVSCWLGSRVFSAGLHPCVAHETASAS